MIQRLSVIVAACLAGIGAMLLVMVVRLPMPFEGLAVVVTALYAGAGTWVLCAVMPARWLWRDSQLLQQAFQAHHGVTALAAANALEAITLAHARADRLRRAAGAMRDDTATQVRALADRLDAAAREIFYVPDRLRALRSVLVRADLIEEAASAHAALRARKDQTTEAASRAKLLTAVEALDEAFTATDLAAARGLLHQVEVASDVAERLLAPRRWPAQTE